MIKWIKQYLKADKKLVATILGLGFIAVVFAVGLMFVAGYLISASADNCYSILMLNIPLAFVQVFGLGKPIARFFERLKSHEWVLRLTSDLRYKLFNVVQKQAKANVFWRTGDVLGSLASDIEHVQNLYLRTVFPVMIAWLVGLLLVIIAGVCSPVLLLLALGMFVLLCVVFPLLSVNLQQAKIQAANKQRAVLYANVTDSVMGAQDVAIAGRGARTTALFLQNFDRVRKNEKKLDRGNRLRLLLIQILLLVAFLIIIHWSYFRFGMVEGGTANWIAAIALGFFPLIDIFAPLSQEFEDGVSHKESFVRLHKQGLLDTPQEAADRARIVEPPYDIKIKRLAYRYDRQNEVLKKVTINIPYGWKVAILGKSGSGKTTLAHIIHGDLVPQEGSVTIGDVPVKEIKESIWNYVGLISQDSYIFAMTIMDNLRIGKIDVSESEAWAALRMVGLEEYVRGLPEGLETMADEAGLNFSGGQRQRLVLARVLLQNPPIVLFDEPTVGLDPITEQLVLDTVLSVFAEKTVIMITHHLQGVDLFDRVLFIEDGSIAMDGPPNLLATENERYQKLLAFDKGFF